MAKIIEKAFDATKKVIRTIFVGQPNLFTTSDVNRQLEAFKYQLDHIEKTLGYLSDMTIQSSYSEVDSEVTIVTEGTFLEAIGCRFNEEGMFGTFTLGNVNRGESVYFIGQMNLKTLDFGSEEDPQHEIVGVNFEDGTSRPAANQVIVSETSYYLSKNIPADESLVKYIVLARVDVIVENQRVGKLKTLVTPYFVRNFGESAIGLVNKVLVDKSDRSRYDNDDYEGVSDCLAKVTEGILHIQIGNDRGRSMGVPCGINGTRPAEYGSGDNLLNYNWNPKWFENFEVNFTLGDPTVVGYLRYIPLSRFTGGSAVSNDNKSLQWLSSPGATVGVLVEYDAQMLCRGIFFAAMIPSGNLVMYNTETSSIFHITNSTDIKNMSAFIGGNFYLDIINGGYLWK